MWLGFLATIMFWLPVSLVLYHWLVFPLLLLLLAGAGRHRRAELRATAGAAYQATGEPSSGSPQERHEAPQVPNLLPLLTVAIPARNEERCLDAKIRNTLAFDYPPDRLEILVGSDASDDATDEIALSFASQGVRLVRLAERGGKVSVLNRLMSEARGDVILFTDADITLEPSAARLMAERFSDARIAVVQADYRRANTDGSPAENLFDRFETWIKTAEGALGAMVTPKGSGMMIRRALCRPLPEDTVHDDLVLGLRPFRQGYSSVYEPRAVARDEVEPEGVEFARRVRIGYGNMQALVRQIDLLSPRYGLKALILFSHKTVRAVTPFFLPLMLIACALKVSEPFFTVLLVLQVAAYGTIPLLGVFRGRWRRLLIPQYYLFMNIALLWGNLQFIFGRRSRHWERTARA